MKTRRIIMIASIGLALLMSTTATPALAQRYHHHYDPIFPLFLPLAVAGAVVGTAAAIATAPFAPYPGYGPGYYGPGPGYNAPAPAYSGPGPGYYASTPRYYAPASGYYGRGPYPYPHRSAWIPAHYNRYGQWVPAHSRY